MKAAAGRPQNNSGNKWLRRAPREGKAEGKDSSATEEEHTGMAITYNQDRTQGTIQMLHNKGSENPGTSKMESASRVWKAAMRG